MRDVLGLIQLLVILMWPMAALAVSQSLGRALTEQSPADWAAVALLSTVSGLVALLNRVRKNMEAGALSQAGKPFEQQDILLLNWRMFTLFHMTGSYMAGFIAFLLGKHLGFESYLHALMISFFAWTGAALLDKMAGEGSNWLSRITGNLPNGPKQ